MKRLEDYCKHREEIDRIELMCPVAIMVMCDVILWCEDRSIPCVITDTKSTLREDVKLKRTSSTHREGRAFDVSVRGWTRPQMDECLKYFSGKYAHLGAISTKTGQPRVVYLHDAGTGEHLHFQFARKFAMLD